jgi:alpha-glucoside transport system permease protein
MGAKFGLMFGAIGLFVLVFAGILLVASRVKGRAAERVQTGSFLMPALLFLGVGLVYPALRTLYESFRGADSSRFVGIDNFRSIFTQPDLLIVVRNTAIWVVLVPVASTAMGLLYAVLVDRARAEALAKTLLFLPMAISFVGASIIWKFVYEYRPSRRPQIGLLNEALVTLGLPPQNFVLLDSPLNTMALVVVLVWIQTGFAMTILSAAIKAIPDDIVDAAQLDGAGGVKMFRRITLPSIRPAVIVVLTAIGIGTMKIFDIVRTMTGGNFDTSVVANEFYNQTFIYNNSGLGSALAVLLFVLVIPIVAFNARQLRRTVET